MSIPSRSISNAASQAAATAALKEALGNCPKDKNGDPYTTCSHIFTIIVRSTIIIYIICVITIGILLLACPDFIESDDLPFLLGFLVFGSMIMLICGLLIHFLLSGKYVLYNEGLEIITPSLKTTIPYSEIRSWGEKYPHLQYKLLYIMVVNNKMIKLNYGSLIGCTQFIALLCEKSDLPLPDLAAMKQRVEGGITSSSKQEKEAYRLLKKTFR